MHRINSLILAIPILAFLAPEAPAVSLCYMRCVHQQVACHRSCPKDEEGNEDSSCSDTCNDNGDECKNDCGGS
jgi:hypothetical protein